MAESFIEVLKHFGKAGAREAAHRGGATNQVQGVAPMQLSKPVNDRSAIRSTSLQHGAYAAADPNANGSHRSGYAAQPQPTVQVQVDQGVYDRRFQSHAQPAPPQQQQGQQGLRPSTIPNHVTSAEANGYNGGRASPSPSQASQASERSKEKKRLKNPFSFKK